MTAHVATGLVVDDDDAVRTVVAWQLEADGHQVRQASDGTTAAGLIAAHRPDLVVLDLSLPGMGSLDVRAGDCLVKRFSPGELAARVHSCCVARTRADRPGPWSTARSPSTSPRGRPAWTATRSC